MEFSSGFHSESASIEFIYEMLQLTGVQYFSWASKAQLQQIKEIMRYISNLNVTNSFGVLPLKILS